MHLLETGGSHLPSDLFQLSRKSEVLSATYGLVAAWPRQQVMRQVVGRIKSFVLNPWIRLSYPVTLVSDAYFIEATI